jgi:uncharacterized protein YdeI (YjbR/CyaY-like superfamily)
MGRNEPLGDIRTPSDLAETLANNPEAAAIWDRLPEAHRRGHVIAIERITDSAARAEHIQHTVDHLLKKHAS